MLNKSEIVRKPLVTEKSFALKEKGVYTFMVEKAANKLQIKDAVEKAFSVKVADVRTATYKGKRKRAARASFVVGKRKDWKKAYVRLKDGFRLDII